MAKQSGLERAAGAADAAELAKLFGLAGANRLPPVQQWNPAHCGSIDMRIARDGQWFYRGTPILRPAMVKLFAGVLRREPDGSFCLVTPVEKLTITVEDAPFMAVELAVEGRGREQRLVLRTNVDDVVGVDAEHPIRVATDLPSGEPRPYVLVRDGLEALIGRSVFYELAELAEPAETPEAWGVWSAGRFFPLGAAVVGN